MWAWRYKWFCEPVDYSNTAEAYSVSYFHDIQRKKFNHTACVVHVMTQETGSKENLM
jgi:hypothetical protein